MKAPTAISIGLDLGHSAVKCTVATLNDPARRERSMFPTVICPALRLSNEESQKAAARDTVKVGDRSYFFGETALRQGRATTFSGQARSWIESAGHDALVLGGWARAGEALAKLGVGPDQDIVLVLGLPTAYLLDQREVLKARVSNLLTPLLSETQRLRVAVKAQSEAPIASLLLTAEGQMDRKRAAWNQESWAVIEVGHFTTDFSVSIRGHMREESAGSTGGARHVYDQLAREFKASGLPSSIDALDQAIRTSQVMLYGNHVSVAEKVEEARRAFADLVVDETRNMVDETAMELNGVIVAGGGATLVFKEIQKAYPNALMAHDPRFAVAEGFCRLGLAVHRAGKD